MLQDMASPRTDPGMPKSLSAPAKGKRPAHPWLRAGVTTLVDTGSPRGGVARLRERVAAASKTAPRLFVSGPIFTAPDGYPAPRREPGAVEVAEGVATPEEATVKIDRLLGGRRRTW